MEGRHFARKLRSGRALRALLALLAALSLPASLPATPALAPVVRSPVFTFRFAPVDGSSYLETERTTRVQSVGQLRRRVMTQESRSRVRVTRIKDGWRFVHTVLSFRATVDGKSSSELFEGLKGARIVIETDAKGKLTRITGLDTLASGMAKKMPLLAGLALETVFDQRAIVAQIREEWADRVSYFAGMQATIGQIWVGSGTLPTVHGAVPYHAVTKVSERLPFQGVSCIRLRYASHTRPEALAKIAPEAVEQARENKLPPARNPGLVEFSSEGERVLDPTTMQLRRERTFKLTRVWMDVPLLGKTAVTHDEQSETTWIYDNK